MSFDTLKNTSIGTIVFSEAVAVPALACSGPVGYAVSATMASLIMAAWYLLDKKTK